MLIFEVMADNKAIVVSQMIPMVSKVIEYKLNGSNSYAWRLNVDRLSGVLRWMII